MGGIRREKGWQGGPYDISGEGVGLAASKEVRISWRS